MSKKQTPPTKTKVLLVDDHPIVRQGIGMLIRQEGDLEVCGEADSAHRALEVMKTAPADISLIKRARG
jgi:DNA-binding NarL/FixJ family response regulator